MFDVRHPVFDEDGRRDDERIQQYIQKFLEQLSRSPEWKEYEATHHTGGWPSQFFTLAMFELRVMPDKMTPEHQQDVLYRLFPCRSLASPDWATDIVHELRAMWRFVKRVHGFTNADACLAELTSQVIQHFQTALADSSKYCRTKLRVLQGEFPFDEEDDEPSEPVLFYLNRKDLEQHFLPPMPDLPQPQERKRRDRRRRTKRKRRR